MELDQVFAAVSDNKSRYERRIKFSAQAETFIKEMESKGFPVSNLVSFIVEQAIPAYMPKGYTYEGYDRLKQQIRTPY
jgi:hypothetical protein